MNDRTRKTPFRNAIGCDEFRDFPIADADACVKCGLCLPHCPTYSLSLNEGDSPRGRIALLQGLAQGALPIEGKALSHLDGCLTCRACERVCPAQVPYGRLIDTGRRGLWRSGHRPGWLWQTLAFWRRTPVRLRWLSHSIRFLERSGLSRLLAGLPLGRIARINKFITTTGKAPRAGTFPPRGAARGQVGLFLGCIARPLDAKVAQAAVRVLNAMGYIVVIPASQVCCGAMDAHAGDTETAMQLARTNMAAFADDVEAILTTASGCGVQLQEYGLGGQQPELEGAAAFSGRVHDIMHFIAAHRDQLPALTDTPCNVVVHTPCTLRNGMREGGVEAVLDALPGAAITPLAHQHCCGAAGSYLFEHAAAADALVGELMDSLEKQAPNVLATSNIGCALHIQRAAKQRGLTLSVQHPVELLAAGLG